MRKKRGKQTYVFKRKASLKKEVYKQLKATNVGIYKEIRKDKLPWWAPTPRNLRFFSIGAIIIGLIAHIHEFGILPISVATYIDSYLVINSNESMVAICIGIGAVLIGFAFFVAQSFLDKEDPDRGRVLLYTSKFYVLLSSEIAILLMYIYGKPNILTTILIVILSGFTILSLYKTVKVLLYANEMEKARLELFKGIIRQFILHEICRRISYQELFKANERLKKRYGKISINPFMQDNVFFTFHSIEEGTIVDINFGVYERLFILLSKKLSQMKLINAQIKSDDIPEKDRITREDDEEKIILCIKALPYSTVKENTVLFGINEGIKKYNPSIKNKSWSIIKRLFIIKKIDIEEKAKLEISKAQQKCITMTRQDNPDAFLGSLQIYKESIYEFFNILKDIDWKFDKEQAAKQRGSFPGERFKLLDWIIESYTLIFYKAVNSDNLHIIRHALYLPISLSKSAIKMNDHLIFQYFIRYPVLMYIEGYKRKEINKEVFEFIIDRSWRYLKELSDFFLKHPYEEGEIEEKDFLGYSFYIFKVFQDLLKHSYDNHDLESFKKYLLKSMKLFEYLEYNTRFRATGKSTYDKINELRNQTLFGMGSWITNRYINNKNDINITYLNEIFQEWELDIVNLTELFIDVHRDSHRWGWDDWEMETKEEGEVHSLNISVELEKFYIIMCLRALQSKPSIDNIHLPFSSELESLTDTLIQFINSIKHTPEKWDVLSENQIIKCDDLISMLKKAKEQQKEKEVTFLRETPISIDKVKAFKEGVLNSMKKIQGIKSIMEFFNAVKYEEESSTLNDKLGINKFCEKEWFIDSEELNTAWVGFDEHIGESMINGENLNILQKIQTKAQAIPLESIEDYLDGIEDLDKVVIIAVNYQPNDFFESRYDSNTYVANWYANFSDKWLKEFPEGLEGVLKYKQHKIPVYEYFNSLSFKGVIIADFKNLKLSQYPLDMEGDERYITIDVQGFPPGSCEEDEIIKKAPEWFKEIGDEKAQRDYIEERVIVKVFEQFYLKIVNNAVAKIPLE